MPVTMTWVGLDVHARSIHAAAIDSMSGELTRAKFACVQDTVAWLAARSGPVRACYEAGPTGYGLYRAALAAGIGIEVIAPSKTPRGKGDRVKNDRKDAELLARLLMAGSLKTVTVPSVRVEAARELTRAHDACRQDLMNARHRVSKMLLRHGIIYPNPTAWTQTHRRWLAAQRFTDPLSDLAYADLLASMDGLTARKHALADRISEVALDPEWWPTVNRLRAFRAINTLTALSVHLELSGNWGRFEQASSVGSWLGMTPSLDQSGEQSRQGAITKSGSILARRLMIEAAWHYRRPPGLGSRALAERQKGQPDHVLQISNRCQQRLHRVYRRMHDRGKPHNVTVVACGRELSCFLWAAATAP
jgi:transposase